MKQFSLIIALLVSITGSQSVAQVKAAKQTAQAVETLINQSIINLSQAGLDKDLIISKIQSSKTNFDLSTAALIALKKEKLDTEIIKAMMGKLDAVSTVTPPQRANASTNSLPAFEIINQVYRLSKASNTAIPLEKAQADMKVKRIAGGYAGANTSYEIPETKSSIRLSASEEASFVVNTGGNAPELVLYQLDIRDNTRNAITMKVKGMFGSGGKGKSGQNTINYNVTQLKPGVYQITLSSKLEIGEYFFATKPNLSASSIDVYAFGID